MGDLALPRAVRLCLAVLLCVASGFCDSKAVTSLHLEAAVTTPCNYTPHCCIILKDGSVFGVD